jgi:hypothetical protein
MALGDYLDWYAVGLAIGCICCLFGYGSGSIYYFFNGVFYEQDDDL